MKKISNVKLGLTALLICASTTAMADDSFTWTGYMRAGTGINSDGGVEGVNENYLGRFGNEYNTWVNSTLHKKITGANGSWAELTLDAYGWVEDPEVSGPWAAGSSDTVTTDNGSFYIGETSVKFGGLDFLPKGATLKVGQMAISEDIHILDYKFKSTTGTGAIYNSNQANKFQLAVLVDEGRGTKSVDGEYTIGNIDTKLTVSQDLEKSDASVSAMVAYNQKKMLGMLPGSTKYIAQLGLGVTAGNVNRNYVNNVDGSAYRFIVDGHGTLGKVSLNPVLWVEGTSYGDDTLDNYTSITAGGRVTQAITNNLEMMYEGFVNAKENVGGADVDGTQYKLSAGPAIQLGMGEWVRPVARFTVTYIGGDQDITGLDKDSEVRLGSQFEAWF